MRFIVDYYIDAYNRMDVNAMLLVFVQWLSSRTSLRES